MDKLPTSLVFGAGATRGALEKPSNTPPPTDRDFFDITMDLKGIGHGTEVLASRVRNEVWKMFGKTSGISLEEYYREIEVRDEVGKIAKTSNQPYQWFRRVDDLTDLIRRVCVHTTCSYKKGGPEPLKSEFHRTVLSGLEQNDTIITFNYDLVIEESFDSSDFWNPVDGYGSEINGVQGDWCRNWLAERSYSKDVQSKVRLLKLHGSLNWEPRASKKILLKKRPYGTQRWKGVPRGDKSLILPPGLIKKIKKAPFKNLWKSARLALEKSSQIIILGYSLPDTDYLARSLFSEVARTRHGRHNMLKKLVLVDKDAAVMARWEKTLKDAIGPNSRIERHSDIESFKKSIQ